MKTLNENLIEFKKYLKSEIAKRKELKLIANRSSKDENYNLEETSDAKSKLEETLEDIHAINVAYYIVKHNLNLDEQKSIQYTVMKHIKNIICFHIKHLLMNIIIFIREYSN